MKLLLVCVLVAILSYTSDAIQRPPPQGKRASDSLMRWVGTMKLLLVCVLVAILSYTSDAIPPKMGKRASDSP